MDGLGAFVRSVYCNPLRALRRNGVNIPTLGATGDSKLKDGSAAMAQPRFLATSLLTCWNPLQRSRSIAVLTPIPGLARARSGGARLQSNALLGQGTLHRAYSHILYIRQYRAVGVHRPTYAGVPQHLLDHLGVGSLRQQNRGEGVPEEVTEAYFRQPSTPQKRP